MSTQAPPRRLVVCIDGSQYDCNGRLANANVSNIFRLKSIIATGVCTGEDGEAFEQVVRYHQAAAHGSTRIDKWRGNFSQAQYDLDHQIKDVTREICQLLKRPEDELLLYGFARGAYVVRAVAGLLHHMGTPNRQGAKDFDSFFHKGLALVKAIYEDDGIAGHRILAELRPLTNGPPIMPFVGVFDSIWPAGQKKMHDMSFVGSLHHLRHAMAFNENRKDMPVELIPTPALEAMDRRSFVQAWFMGSHLDMGGGSDHDGLSLYPLQWMIIETMRTSALVLQPSPPAKEVTGPDIEHPLRLAFPQFVGGIPSLSKEEQSEWRLQFTNGIQVSMFDLQTVHAENPIEKDLTHMIRVNQTNALYNSPRRIFDSTGLIGWNEAVNYGTIIHPSLYSIIDRNPQYKDHIQPKVRRDQLADFQERYMRDNDAPVPPWLENMTLQASGVKAFRILVCGKTGVGKSTLINKVFGVEMTEESNTYAQGQHDIDKAFESPNHPGLLIHDSRGWQAGSDKELELIAKFLRHRAFQKDPAEALHVIWFCVDSDVSRIEEADKRTFNTIAQFSHHVPVFVVGTKKDKLVAFRKIQVLESLLEKGEDYMHAKTRAAEEADQLAEEQFLQLRNQLSQIEHYKADGYCCLSKDDPPGIKKLLDATLELIADDRVRLFAVAAQVVDVQSKIDSAISECMRLSTHAVRTAMVPLPCSGIIGTPTVSRIICEHVLQCFGFPKAAPEAVEEIMSRVVMGNLKSYMKVSLTQLAAVGAATLGVAVPTLGIGVLVGVAGSLIAAPPAARMLFKCACDMILILERSFRYKGKFVSSKQIEDAAVYYTTTMTKTFSGKDKRLQDHVHDEVDRLVPLKKISAGFKFSKLRQGFERIVYSNRFDPASKDALLSPVRTDGSSLTSTPSATELLADTRQPPELLSPTTPAGVPSNVVELPGSTISELASPAMTRLPGDKLAELPAKSKGSNPGMTELPADVHRFPQVHSPLDMDAYPSLANTTLSKTATVEIDSNSSTLDSRLSDFSIARTAADFEGEPSWTKADTEREVALERGKSENFFSRSMKAMGPRRFMSRGNLKKSKTGD